MRADLIDLSINCGKVRFGWQINAVITKKHTGMASGEEIELLAQEGAAFWFVSGNNRSLEVTKSMDLVIIRILKALLESEVVLF